MATTEPIVITARKKVKKAEKRAAKKRAKKAARSAIRTHDVTDGSSSHLAPRNDDNAVTVTGGQGSIVRHPASGVKKRMRDAAASSPHRASAGSSRPTRTTAVHGRDGRNHPVRSATAEVGREIMTQAAAVAAAPIVRVTYSPVDAATAAAASASPGRERNPEARKKRKKSKKRSDQKCIAQQEHQQHQNQQNQQNQRQNQNKVAIVAPSHADVGDDDGAASDGRVSPGKGVGKHLGDTAGKRHDRSDLNSNNSGGNKKEQEARLSKCLEHARKRHRQEIGKGRPLIGWDISAFAQRAFADLAAMEVVSSFASVQSAVVTEELLGTEAERLSGGEDDGEVVKIATEAVTSMAEEDYAGQVTISQFETLFRREATGFSVRRRAASMLAQALKQEQSGNLDAAEASCSACLAAWPAFAKGQLKMAQILRARGMSAQRAIHAVEFHLRQVLGSASKPGNGVDSEIAQTAAERLALLLCQEGRDKEAAKLLKKQGFRYRLSADVLRYPLVHKKPSLADEPEESDRDVIDGRHPAGQDGREMARIGGGPKSRGRTGDSDGAVDASQFVSALDKALPSSMLAHLQEAFGSQSRFWSEHGYNSETGTPGYFSYIHSLQKPPTTSIEQVILHVKNLAERNFPAVKEAKFVEWWAHRRPHSSGHQMHFDSDNEGRGGVRNPIVSVVVYVTGEVGGPTLVTTQRLTSKRLADQGWIVHPRVNRVCMFDGSVLHGVIPGRGVPSTPTSPMGNPAHGATSHAHIDCGGNDQRMGDPAAAQKSAALSTRIHSTSSDTASGHGSSSSRNGSKGLSKDEGVKDDGKMSFHEERAGMRVTWMVAFWKDIEARPRIPVSPARKPKGTSPHKDNRSGESVPPSGAGAAQPFPMAPHAESKKGKKLKFDEKEGVRPTWPSLFNKKPDGWGMEGRGGRDGDLEVPVKAVPVPHVWEDVDEVDNRRRGAGVRRLKRLPPYELCYQGF